MILSVVTTLYYSEKYIQEFVFRTENAVAKIGIEDYEIIFVNDGSPDNSASVVKKYIEINPKCVLVNLSRNFGHHYALREGLVQAKGEFVFLIDSDLEEAPELLEDYWCEMQKDPESSVVYGVQRRRKGSFFERFSGKIFYKIFRSLINVDYPADSLTARLMKKKYVDAVLRFDERELDLWSMFALAGFKQVPLVVSKGAKGTSTYTIGKRASMAVQSITAVSNRPLYYIFFLGMFITVAAMFLNIFLILRKLIYNDAYEGWTSTIVTLWSIGGMIIFCLGIIGIYLSKIFTEVKRRPLSIVEEIHTIKKQGNEENLKRNESLLPNDD
jgi:putative glycosyltransferase